LHYDRDKAEAIEEEQARFRLWVKHVGVFARHHNSLDFRLRDSKTDRSLVLNQLHILRFAVVHFVGPQDNGMFAPNFRLSCGTAISQLA
jgi:hypothetical protein